MQQRPLQTLYEYQGIRPYLCASIMPNLALDLETVAAEDVWFLPAEALVDASLAGTGRGETTYRSSGLLWAVRRAGGLGARTLESPDAGDQGPSHRGLSTGSPAGFMKGKKRMFLVNLLK